MIRVILQKIFGLFLMNKSVIHIFILLGLPTGLINCRHKYAVELETGLLKLIRQEKLRVPYFVLSRYLMSTFYLQHAIKHFLPNFCPLYMRMGGESVISNHSQNLLPL